MYFTPEEKIIGQENFHTAVVRLAAIFLLVPLQQALQLELPISVTRSLMETE